MAQPATLPVVQGHRIRDATMNAKGMEPLLASKDRSRAAIGLPFMTGRNGGKPVDYRTYEVLQPHPSDPPDTVYGVETNDNIDHGGCGKNPRKPMARDGSSKFALPECLITDDRKNAREFLLRHLIGFAGTRYLHVFSSSAAQTGWKSGTTAATFVNSRFAAMSNRTDYGCPGRENPDGPQDCSRKSPGNGKSEEEVKPSSIRTLLTSSDVGPSRLRAAR